MTGLRIETDRLWMRPYLAQDLAELHQLFTDSSIRRYLLDDQIVPREWVAEEIRVNTESFDQNGYGQWAVFLKAGEEAMIGFCGYRNFHHPPELQLLYGLRPNFWGRGLATEAAREMLRRGFEVHGFDRVVGSTDAPNEPSQKVMERIGMTFDRREPVHGLDTLFYVMSRDDFERRKRRG